MNQRYLTLIAALLLILCIFFMGCSLNNQNDEYKTAANDITMKELAYSDTETVYEEEYQNNLLNQLEKLKKEGKYTIDNPLIVVDPFKTNTTGVYLYFKSDNKCSVDYTVHVEDPEIMDFTRRLNNGSKNNLTKEHEYLLIGCIGGMDNTITLNLYNKNDNLYCTKKFDVKVPEINEDTELKLLKQTGDSDKELSEGLFTTLGYINTSHHNTYLYDNDGIARSEMKLEDYRSDRYIFKDDLIYMSTGKSKIIGMNRLGYVSKVYDLGKYELHHDYVLGKDDKLIILANNTELDSEEDIVITLNLKDKEVKEIINMEDLMDKYKSTTVVPEGKSKLDWLHINSLCLLDENSILLSSRETSTIIKVADFYDNPKIEYFIGDEKFWSQTPYKDYVLNKDGEFAIHGGQHSITVDTDKGYSDGKYYLYMFNNNTGVTSSAPDYDWSYAKDINSISMFYEYEIDEKAKTFTLVNEFDVPASRYISSVQKYEGNIVIDCGQDVSFMEYDGNDDLIAKYNVTQEMWGMYRCYKYSYDGFYFKNTQK